MMNVPEDFLMIGHYLNYNYATLTTSATSMIDDITLSSSTITIIINGDCKCSFTATYRQAYGSSLLVGPKVSSCLALFCIHRVNWVSCPHAHSRQKVSTQQLRFNCCYKFTYLLTYLNKTSDASVSGNCRKAKQN